jgi:Asp-tRNA(Asn)/Glu-tRNA(Gln) amidotransferase B subunit
MVLEELVVLIENALVSYTEQIAKYKNGEVKVLQFLVGKVMAEVKGKAPATQVREQVENYLKGI